MFLEPKIIAFCCNWCSYAAADLAGTARMNYPTSVRIIRVMCSGMVHPEFVIEALNMGADAVMILGCRLNECHYQDGNHKALARSELIFELMEDLGYEKERFSLHWLSSNEPDKFVTAITEMDRKIRKLSDL
jgi:F420-non-reducing hydrogenase iron-sulfur subunit